MSVDVERFARHIMLREIGGPGQARLAAAHVAIVGVGGLGGPAALYLAAAGVGRLTLIDDDAVSLSNLQRQILFRTGEVGEPKVEAARRTLGALNPGCAITACEVRLDDGNAGGLLGGAGVVLDGSDSFSTRFAVNAACHASGKTLVAGAVGRWTGQVGVFRSGQTRGEPVERRSPCYRCLVPEPPEAEETCAAAGVAGPLTGVVGSMMALESIKIVVGAGRPLDGRLLVFEGLTGDSRVLTLPPDPVCPVCAA